MSTDPSNEEETKDAEIEDVVYVPTSDPDHVGDVRYESVVSMQGCFVFSQTCK